jgi:hypothetical protein
MDFIRKYFRVSIFFVLFLKYFFDCRRRSRHVGVNVTPGAKYVGVPEATAGRSPRRLEAGGAARQRVWHGTELFDTLKTTALPLIKKSLKIFPKNDSKPHVRPSI